MELQVFHNFSLEALNTFKIAAYAARYVRFKQRKELELFCSTVDLTKTAYFPLGGGSNTLFVENFEGYVLHIQLPGIDVVKEKSHNVYLQVGAGVSWHDLVLYCVQKGYGGIENLALIPGTVGGACVQNIGAYGVEIQEVIIAVQAIETATGKTKVFQKAECAFGYRSSGFKTLWPNEYIITSATFKLHKEAIFTLTHKELTATLTRNGIDRPSLHTISEAIIAIRKRKLPDPTIVGNAGSFFKNPIISNDIYKKLKERYPYMVAFRTDESHVKISAGWLIEMLHLKGFRKGNVGIHDKHALVLVNHGGGKGKEVLDLANYIKKCVANQFNIILAPEVKIVGAKEN